MLKTLPNNLPQMHPQAIEGFQMKEAELHA